MAAGEVGLSAAQGLHSVEDGYLWLFGWTCDAGLGSQAIGHQAVVEEIPEVPVLAERTGAKIFQIVYMKISCQVMVGKIWWQK